ncbi:MAG: ribosome maturation factor RimP [Clostridia bacterium]|nr:ribosome maturation factor RimP [Clostridia bacterium]
MAKKKQGNTVELVTELVKPIVENMGLTLWDVRFVKEGANWYLRIFIDKDSGVTIEDCEAVTRAIDKPLDDLDPIEQNYCLEVSSPGIERELTKDEHFDAFLSAPVMVKTIRPDENGDREFKGTLIAHTKDDITLALESGEQKVINKKDTVYIKLDDFNI